MFWKCSFISIKIPKTCFFSLFHFYVTVPFVNMNSLLGTLRKNCTIFLFCLFKFFKWFILSMAWANENSLEMTHRRELLLIIALISDLLIREIVTMILWSEKKSGIIGPESGILFELNQPKVLSKSGNSRENVRYHDLSYKPYHSSTGLSKMGSLWSMVYEEYHPIYHHMDHMIWCHSALYF